MTQILSAGSVVLRPLTRRDAPHVLHAIECSRGELAPWMWWEESTNDERDVAQWIATTTAYRKRGTDRTFGVFSAVTGEFFGGAGLHEINLRNGHAELGYWVRSDRHRRGVAFTSAVAVLRFGFETLRLHRVSARADVRNAPSLALIRKLGFVEEGVAREDIRVRGAWYDHVRFSMLEPEYAGHLPRFDSVAPRRAADR